MPLSTRLAHIPPTVFSEMSALALRTGAINLGQGFPDVDGPPSVIAAAEAALEAGANQYAPGIGVPALRAAIARHQQRHYGLEVDPDREVVVTTGCTEAVAAALLGLVDPGDEVVVLEPYYDSYVAMLDMCGARRRPVTLRAPGFRPDLDELQVVADLAIEHDVVVVTDEVYEHLVFDGRAHVPIATLPGMWERTLTLSSAGKSYSFTGWKVGWATGPAPLVQAVLAAKQWLTFTSGSPLQPAVAHALDQEPDWPRELARDLQARRDLLCDGLTAAGLSPRVPEGTYFATTDVSHLGWADGRELCLALPDRAGVVAIPAQGFYDAAEAGRQLVRWAFCKQPDVISEGVRRLAAADLHA